MNPLLPVASLAGLLSFIALTGAIAPHAQAQGVAAFVIENSTGATIKYQVKWGKGNWKSCKLPPKRQMAHSYRIRNGNAPTPKVRFDWIPGNEDFNGKTYRVQARCVQNPEWGRRYVFRYSKCGCYLYLYRK